MIIFLGLLMYLTPSVLAIMDGVENGEDAQLWMMSKSLEEIIKLQFMQRFGMQVIILGSMLYFVPEV